MAPLVGADRQAWRRVGLSCEMLGAESGEEGCAVVGGDVAPLVGVGRQMSGGLVRGGEFGRVGRMGGTWMGGMTRCLVSEGGQDMGEGWVAEAVVSTVSNGGGEGVSPAR